MEKQVEKKLEEMTMDELMNKYARVASKAGDLQYQMKCQLGELDAVNLQLNGIQMAAKALKEKEARPVVAEVVQ